MKLTYHPEGSTEPRVWEFSFGKLRRSEMVAIEKVTGLPYGSEFKMALQKGDTNARAAMLWHFLHKDHVSLKFADVDFADDELVLEQSLAEWQESYEQLLKTPKVPGLNDEEREAALELMLSEIAAAKKAEQGDDEPPPSGAEDGEGKAPDGETPA